MIAARQYLGQGNRLPHHPGQPISILKPLSGAEDQLEQNLRTFFLQQYETFEILFAVRRADDPAVTVVEKLQVEYPAVPVRLILTGEPPYGRGMEALSGHYGRFALRPVSGGLLFLAITAPWFVAVSAANSEFAHFFFVQEHFQRFTTEMHQRAHPAWYFIPVLAAGMAPWLVPLGHAAVRAFRQRSDAELLLWAWVLVVFVFFSASGSKLPPYILPIFPALAVLAARSLTRGVLIAQSLVMLPVALGAGLAVHRLASGGPYAGYASWILFAALILAATAAAALFLARRDRLLAAVLALALGGLAATQIGLAGQCTRPRNHGLEFTQGGFQAVHFPVAGDQGPDGVGHVDYPRNVSVADALAEARRQFQIPGGRSPGR